MKIMIINISILLFIFFFICLLFVFIFLSIGISYSDIKFLFERFNNFIFSKKSYFFLEIKNILQNYPIIRSNYQHKTDINSYKKRQHKFHYKFTLVEFFGCTLATNKWSFNAFKFFIFVQCLQVHYYSFFLFKKLLSKII